MGGGGGGEGKLREREKEREREREMSAFSDALQQFTYIITLQGTTRPPPQKPAYVANLAGTQIAYLSPLHNMEYSTQFESTANTSAYHSTAPPLLKNKSIPLTQ